MLFSLRRSIVRVACTSVLLISAFPALSLTADQKAYQAAKEAITAGDTHRYQQLRQQLVGYPLTIYLDYQWLSRDLRNASHHAIDDYLKQYGQTPPGIRLRGQYLRHLGKTAQWQNYLSITDSPPRSTALKCYHQLAYYHTGNQEVALTSAEQIWLHGRSLPDECDPLFKLLKQHGKLTDDLIWQRMQLVFKARQSSLLQYLNRSLSVGIKPWGDRLIELYNAPRKLRQHKRYRDDSAINRSIVRRGIERLAAISPQQAVKQWEHYRDSLSFSQDEQLDIDRYIGYRAMLRHDKEAMQWLDARIATIASDKLVELRLRRALKAQEWQMIASLFPLLSDEKQQSTRWIYWQARTLATQGKPQEADLLLTQIAEKRSFYGFMAADHLTQPYQLNNHTSTPESAPLLSAYTQQAMARIQELKALDKLVAARSEWNNLLLRADPQETPFLPSIAADNGWWDYTITGAIHNGQWDDLQLRFPAPYRTEFQQFSKMRHLDEALLLAVSRRESSFYTHATSGKNAVG